MTALNWDHLQTFLAVARHGRLSSAAAKLGTDHTTLARRITALEQALNAKLFERRSTGYSLTPEGSTLLLFADSIDRLTLRAFETIGGTASAVEGAVRLAVPEGFGSYFLASRVGKLATIHPRLSIQLVFGGGAYSLTKRETDILVTVTRPTEGRLFMRKLVDYDLGLFATAQYLAANPAIEDRADLPQHRFVGYIEDLLQSPELDYLGEIHPALRTVVESSNLVAQVFATLAGTGLCVLPNFIAARQPDLVPVLPNDVRLVRSFWMVAHSDLKDLARVRAVMDFVAQEVEASRWSFAP